MRTHKLSLFTWGWLTLGNMSTVVPICPMHPHSPLHLRRAGDFTIATCCEQQAHAVVKCSNHHFDFEKAQARVLLQQNPNAILGAVDWRGSA